MFMRQKTYIFWVSFWILSSLSAFANQVESTFDMHSRALIAKQNGNYVEAESLLKKVLSLEPENGNAFFDLGNLFLQEGKYSEALRNFELAKDNGYEVDANFYKALAICYLGLGKNKESIFYFEKCLQIDRDCPQANDLLEMAKNADKDGRTLTVSEK